LNADWVRLWFVPQSCVISPDHASRANQPTPAPRTPAPRPTFPHVGQTGQAGVETKVMRVECRDQEVGYLLECTKTGRAALIRKPKKSAVEPIQPRLGWTSFPNPSRFTWRTETSTKPRVSDMSQIAMSIAHAFNLCCSPSGPTPGPNTLVIRKWVGSRVSGVSGPTSQARWDTTGWVTYSLVELLAVSVVYLSCHRKEGE